MWLQKLARLLNGRTGQSRSHRAGARAKSNPLGLEQLESRKLLSVVNWVNRGLDSDRFDSTFGPNADLARTIVDAAIETWDRVVTDLNHPGGLQSLNVNISMESGGTGFGGEAAVSIELQGFPVTGFVRLKRGNDTNGDGIGDGAGYFLDPTPFDHSEFAGPIVHAFTGDAQAGSPAAGRPDFFTVVVHELAHVLGIDAYEPLRLHDPLFGSVTDTGLPDDSEGRGVGRYIVFDGPSVTHLMTSNTSGRDAVRIFHSAGPPHQGGNQPVEFASAFRGTRELVGTHDLINPLFEVGRRSLPPDYLALVLQDAYGYDVTLPQTFGTFYAMLNEDTGELLVRGSTSETVSDDAIRIARVGNKLRVSVDIGADTPGSGPHGDASSIPAYVSEFPLAAVQSIVIRGGEGEDSLFVDFSGGDPIPPGGIRYQAGMVVLNWLTVDLAHRVKAIHVGLPDGIVHFPVSGKAISYQGLRSVSLLRPPNAVRAVQLFYNGSAFDANGHAVDERDFAAIAQDKTPLRLGGRASFSNMSGYSRGINGLFVDFSDLPQDGLDLDATDFEFSVGNSNFPETWGRGPEPTAVGVLPNSGVNGSDRVFVTFPNGSITNTWLRVTVKATESTGLEIDEDYFFGAVPGETGANISPERVAVNAVDLASIAANITPLAQFGTEPVDEPHDLNRDRAVSALDFAIVAANLSPSAISLIEPAVLDEMAAGLAQTLHSPPAGWGDSERPSWSAVQAYAEPLAQRPPHVAVRDLSGQQVTAQTMPETAWISGNTKGDRDGNLPDHVADLDAAAILGDLRPEV